ncbi:MAG TPA: 3D-(3,5/4)-trihydroxycyclohexane-1,2-dione acylhydrolase (decyclizing) [Thermoleophilaceae bacterium]|nr:3D-(3,5/4)-trihydroxycyclohexane-1,2-dione acylhydrolase (decyclizing) [Thermoleophilaceae bacterium]
MGGVRLTTAQALVRFLGAQWTERDGVQRRLVEGCFGIFGHGNVAGVGQALQEEGALPFHQGRNEQAMVHVAAGFARMRNRLSTLACTTSIGPGATNLVTGAALATINRLPVLLLPGDVFATRGPHPVLQGLELSWDGDSSVNDCLRPVSRYWTRVNRPEQLEEALLSAARVLTDQAETGAVTLALPQDVQAEAHEFPEELFDKRVWRIPRPAPALEAVAEAAELLRGSSRPLIVSGGGTIYSEATAALRELCEATGVPCCETQAGKGSLPHGHPQNLGPVGVTGSPGANRAAREADVVLGVGTRWSDFTTASKTAFQNPELRFVNLNVAAFDAAKHAGLMLVGDAREGLEALGRSLAGFGVEDSYRGWCAEQVEEWDRELERLYGLGHGPPPAQSEVIGAVCEAAGPQDVVVCAAGSMPGDLHKLWRARNPKSYHVEYGYSCMGYELPGGMGVKLAAPEREVFVMIGDGSCLMLPGDLVTAVAEGVKLVVVLVDNHGYASIGALSRSVGSAGFGTHYRRSANGSPPTDDGAIPEKLPIDLAANAESLGARVLRARTIPELRAALDEGRAADGVVVVHIEVDRYAGVPSYESWWDVPVAEVSEIEATAAARAAWEAMRARERSYL